MKCYFCENDAQAMRAHQGTTAISGTVTYRGFIFLCRDHDQKSTEDKFGLITGIVKE